MSDKILPPDCPFHRFLEVLGKAQHVHEQYKLSVMEAESLHPLDNQFSAADIRSRLIATECRYKAARDELLKAFEDCLPEEAFRDGSDA